MKAIIVTAKGVQDQELIYPQYRLLEAGYEVDLAADGPFAGILGVPFEPTRGLPQRIEASDYELVVIPGGVKAMERLRLNAYVVEFISAFHAAGKVVASICSGAQLLISAGLVRGRTISSYPAMRVDVENAGGTWHPGPVFRFDRIVTAPHYRNLGEWMRETLLAVEHERSLNDAA